MKKTMIRLIALVMALLCAATLFGCAEEEEDSTRRKRKSSKKETTEDVYIEEELSEEQAVGIYKPEETKKNKDQKTEKDEEVAVTSEPKTAAVEDQLPDPGTIQLPAANLLDYDYDTLCKLNWFTLQTEKMDDRWILTTNMDGATFTFVFKDLNSKPIVLTVEDLNDKSGVYVTYDIQLGDTASELPNEVRSAIGAMDGGLYASATINGYSADFMLDGDMDNVDNAVVFLMQIRREG